MPAAAPQGREALPVDGLALRLAAEVVDRAGPALVIRGQLRAPVRLHEVADPLDEHGIVDSLEAPLGQRVGLVLVGVVQRLVLLERPAAGRGREHVVADHVHAAVAGVVACGRVRAVLDAGERIPDHAQAARVRVDREIPGDRRQPLGLQPGVDLRLGAAVEQDEDPAERALVRGRRVGRVVLALVRVEVDRIVHLGHRPDVDELAELADRAVQREEVRIAAAGGDRRGCDRLALARRPRSGAQVEHRHRAEHRQQVVERRAVALPLTPAEKGLVHGRLLAGELLEVADVAGDPEQDLRPGSRRGRGDDQSQGDDGEGPAHRPGAYYYAMPRVFR